MDATQRNEVVMTVGRPHLYYFSLLLGADLTVIDNFID